MDRQTKFVNLLHPLASLAEWKEYRRIPVDMRDAQAVVLGDKVYLGGGDAPDGPSSELLIYDFTNDSWDKVSTPTQWYSLAVYCSQLVLVGGVDPLLNTITNKLWVLGDNQEWKYSTIPAMLTERFGASAMSVGKHLIVAGGNNDGRDGHLSVVEVYDGHEWRRIQSLPQSCSRMKSVVDEGFWYLAGGVGQGKKVFYASLDSLTTPEGAKQKMVWEILPEAPIERSTPVIFGMQLTTVGGLFKSAMHAYSHRTKTWVHVGDLPVAYSFVCSLVLPSQELLMVGRKAQAENTSHVFRAKIQVASFPDSNFTISALERLEAVSGISVYKQLVSKLPAMVSTFYTDTRDMFQEWISDVRPPTWQTLLVKLLGIDDPLAKAIEDFLQPKTQMPSQQHFMWKSKEDEQQTESEVQLYREKRDQALEHNKLLKAENEQLKAANKQLKLELGRQLHQSEDTDMETTGYLRGMSVIGETSILITNQAQSFQWEGYGLKLHVPEGILQDLEYCRLFIKVGLSGEFKLPENTCLVSAVYWIDSKPRCKFSKPGIRMEIQHCSKTHQNLSFVRAKCSQDVLPYTFNTLKEGQFSSIDVSSYGSIHLSHFSMVGVGQKGREDPRYCAGFYYIGSKSTFWRVHFVVIKDLEASRTEVTNCLKDAVVGGEVKVEFEKDSISLNIPRQGTEVDGWAIQVVTPTVVTKEQVDVFQSGTLLPSCQLQLYPIVEPPKRLCHQVTLIGAKEPFNFLAIQSEIKPLSQQLQRTSSVKPILDEDNADLRSKYPNGLSDEPLLRDLMEQVAAKIPAKWRRVGIALNLNQSDLECLPVLDCHRCFETIFTTWKKQETSPYTWLTILDALKTETVGENHLAKEITSRLLE